MNSDEGRTDKEIVVSFRDIKKSFSKNIVLKGISLDISRGEVVAVVGGNGAGKSTLMKILMGIYQPDGGEIWVDGKKATLSTPSAALGHGIYYIPQEPMIFPHMTVEENILIGFKEKRSVLKPHLIELMKKTGWQLALDRKGETLSIAEQQLVEILRGLMREASILILDEPTSALTFHEIEALFKMIGVLKNQSISMFYITHRLAEVFQVASRVVILRDGMVTIDGPVEKFTKEMLIQGLLPPCNTGENSVCFTKKRADLNYETLQPLLKVENLCGHGFEDVSFSVYPGEILGIAGVVGAGRTELATSIFGLDEITSGCVYLDNTDIAHLTQNETIEKGLNYVPEDRHENGIFMNADVTSNITSALICRMKFFLDRKKEKSIARKYIDSFNIRITSQEQLLSSLSGGNQQKVVLGRILSTDPKVIMLDEPTRGIDAGARRDVYRIIQELRNTGVGILLISSDMEEIVELCDRAAVMVQGRMEYFFTGEEIELDSLMCAAYGVYSSVE